MRTRAAAVFGSLVGAAGLGALLFAGAGTTEWVAGWVFVALFAVVGVVASLVAPKAILRERLRGPIRSGQAAADVVFVPVFGAVLAGWFVLMGIDAHRFEWSSVPASVHVLGAVLLVAANAVALWAMCANQFASASVRIDDAQRVASSGPYRAVRHPMYAGVLLYVPGTALLLGSLWGAAATLVIAVGLSVRIAIEERALRAGLPGYVDYASRVRWRLVPGLW